MYLEKFLNDFDNLIKKEYINIEKKTLTKGEK